MQFPLVSCIMPTANRRRFVEKAIDYFRRQTYPNLELVVIDDGIDDGIDDLCVGGNIFCTGLSRITPVGQKRNVACKMSAGEYIAHWDDDDWQSPERIAVQVDALITSGAELCGMDKLLYFDVRDQTARKYVYPDAMKKGLALGNTFMYRRELWARRPFEPIQVGEDMRFLWGENAPTLHVIQNQTLMMGVIHGTNVAPKNLDNPVWKTASIAEVVDLVREDLPFYTSLSLKPS